MNILNDFRFNLSPEGKQIYTREGSVYLRSVEKRSFSKDSMTFAFKIHTSNKLKKEEPYYKITELIELPFTKVNGEQPYVDRESLNFFIYHTFILYIANFFKNKKPLPILPIEKPFKASISSPYGNSYYSTNDIGIGIYTTEYSFSRSGYHSSHIGKFWFPLIISQQELKVLP